MYLKGFEKEPKTCKERLNEKGKVDTSEEYRCLVSRFPTLLLTQKWYVTAPLSNHKVLMGGCTEGRDEKSKIKPQQRYCIKTYSPFLNNTLQDNSTLHYSNT